MNAAASCVVLAAGKRSRFFLQEILIIVGGTPHLRSDRLCASGLHPWQLNQFDVIYAKGKRQLVKSNDCGISVPLLEAADVLLTKARDIREPLLRQALLLSETLDVSPDQSAHIHTQRSADYII